MCAQSPFEHPFCIHYDPNPFDFGVRHDKIRPISKSFDGGRSYAVKELSLRVNTGETLVLLGSSGCGKTTMINRLIEPSDGRIEVGGEDIIKLDPVR